MEESSIQEEKKQPKPKKGHYEENTYNEHYHSSFKASQPASSQKPSSKKEHERSKKGTGSKLEVSQGDHSRKFETHGKTSNNDISGPHRTSERASGEHIVPQEDENDDVISNSSSFSQFSISGSQKRDVGKISRRSNNWSYNIWLFPSYLTQESDSREVYIANS